MISTTISHPRSFHVTMFSTPGTFWRGQNYASVKDFEYPETETRLLHIAKRDILMEENYMISKSISLAYTFNFEILRVGGQN